MPMPMMPGKNPQTEAINRTLNAQGGAPVGKPPIPGQEPQGRPMGANPGQPGGQQSPIETALKILELVAQRLGQMNPQAAQKLTAAIESLKSVIEEVKKELSANGGKPPVAGQPAGATPPAAVPGPNQPGGRPMPSQPMPPQ